jgi:serine phosphatase RsbU (regulator of sigma subunit)/CBS domain-containing protein
MTGAWRFAAKRVKAAAALLSQGRNAQTAAILGKLAGRMAALTSPSAQPVPPRAAAAADAPLGGGAADGAGHTDLRALVGHRTAVRADEMVGRVYEMFTTHRVEFIAVLDGERLIGMCSRREVGMLLGARFGFALFAQKPIREHLSPETTRVAVRSPLPEVLAQVSSRSAEAFYDDVLLVEDGERFVGLIPAHALVRVQHRLLADNIRQLEEKQREISAKNEQIETDLRMARQLQQALVTSQVPAFPPEATGEACRLRFHHRYLPCGTVGGDLFHVVRVSDLAAGVFIGDVMGHGVRSALMMAMLRGLVEELRADVADPGVLLTRLNVEWMRILRQTEDVLFATALYAVVDAAAGQLRYATAGHPVPLLVRASERTVERLRCSPEAAGPVLGLFEPSVYATSRHDIASGDLAVFFTDGLYEVANADGAEFGVERLVDALGRCLGYGPAEMIDAALTEARWFSPTGTFSDDVCLLGVEVGRAG